MKTEVLLFKLDEPNSIVMKVEVDNHTIYYDVRFTYQNLAIAITDVGVVKPSEMSFKYMEPTRGKYKGTYDKAKLHQDILENVPKEVLLAALKEIKDRVTIVDDWIK